MLALPILLSALLRLPQAVETPETLVTVIELEAEAELFGERGRVGWVDYQARFDGTLHVWTRAKLDVFLHAENESRVMVGADDNSGGGTAPYLELKVKKWQKFRFALVANDPESTGWIKIHVIPSPETHSARRAASKCMRALGWVAKLNEQGSFSRARELVAESYEFLRSAEGPKFNLPCANAMNTLVAEATKCGSSTLAITGFEYMLSFLEQTKPPEHPEVARMRVKLALARKRTGDFAGAKVLEEQVVSVRERMLPPAHPLVTNALRNLADTLLGLGEIEEARKLFEWVIDIRARVLKPEDPELLTLQARLASVEKALGNVPAAREFEEQFLEAVERLLPADDPELARARLNLAQSLVLLGELYRARDLYELAVLSKAAELPAADPELLSAEAEFAAVLRLTGEVERAIGFERKILEAREDVFSEDHALRLNAMANLASSLHDAGELEEALSLRQTVVEALEKLLSPVHEDLLRARLDLSISESELGAYETARKTQLEILGSYEASLALEHPDRLKARHCLALTLGRLGDLNSAYAYMIQVLGTRQRVLAEDHPTLLQTRLDVARASEVLGDLEGALSQREQVLPLFEARRPNAHHELLSLRQSIALLLMKLGRLEEALELQTSVFDAWEGFGKSKWRELNAARHLLAIMFLEVGEPELALSELEQVFRTNYRELGSEHHETLLARGRFAELLASEGDVAEAVGHLERLLALRSKSLPASHELITQLQTNVTLAWYALEEAEKANYRYSRVHKFLSDRLLEALTRDWLESREILTFDAPAMDASSLLHNGLEFAVYTGLFELSANRLLAETSSGARPAAILGDAELANLASAAANLRSRVEARLTSYDLEEGKLNQTDAILSELSKESAAAEAALQEALRTRGLLPDLIRGWPSTQLLAPKTAAVQFLRYPKFSVDSATNRFVEEGDYLMAIVLVNGAKITSIELGPIAKLEPLILNWRSAIGAPLESGSDTKAGAQSETDAESKRLPSPNALEDDPELAAGRELRTTLLSPILKALDPGLERLYLLPDDLLHLIPLDALPSYGERVGDQLEVVVLPAIPSLVQPAMGPIPKPRLLAVGAIDYAVPGAEFEQGRWVNPAAIGSLSDSSESPSFEPLPRTGTEIQTVLTVYFEEFESEGSVLSEELATKATLAAVAGEFEFIHIATHGWFASPELGSGRGMREWSSAPYLSTERETPEPRIDLRSGIALTGASRGRVGTGRVPGILTPRELSAIDFSACRLAVLSGFNPALDPRASVQALEAMRSALHKAGANASLISIWEADPEATDELFKNFYTFHWRDGLPMGQALWKAKLSLRLSGRPVKDWAGWVFTGTPWR